MTEYREFHALDEFVCEFCENPADYLVQDDWTRYVGEPQWVTVCMGHKFTAFS